MADIIHEFIVSKTGDWGKSGRDYCSKCQRSVNMRYKYCPWCGERFQNITNVEIVRDGGMWDG